MGITMGARLRLQDKVAVITGGASGIGLAIAREFTAEGAKVVIFGRNDETLTKAKTNQLPEALTVQGDVTKTADLENLFSKTIEHFGKLDIVVANAGVATFLPIEAVKEEDFDRMVDINFKGAFFTVQKALPHLKRGASIVLVSSNAHAMGVPTASIYCGSKAAVRSLARTLSAELLPRGIRVNCLSPGPTETPIFGKMGMSEAQLVATREHMKKQVPLKRMAAPREMATVAVFLASNDSSFIVGEDILADGGWISI